MIMNLGWFGFSQKMVHNCPRNSDAIVFHHRIQRAELVRMNEFNRNTCYYYYYYCFTNLSINWRIEFHAIVAIDAWRTEDTAQNEP